MKTIYYYQRVRVPDVVKTFKLSNISKIRRNPKIKGPPSLEVLKPYKRGEGFLNLKEDKESYYKEEPCVRGGCAVCIITDDDNNQFTGVSTCSFSDTFSYQIGRELAEQRALELVKEGKK